MVYAIKAKYRGRFVYGTRLFKSKSGAKRAINTQKAKAFIKRKRLTYVMVYKKRKMPI